MARNSDISFPAREALVRTTAASVLHKVHRPSAQPSRPLHFLPQLPQLFRSLRVFTHSSEQAESPELQRIPHWLSMQVAVPLVGTSQPTPHWPQLAASLLRSTQRPEQGTNPGLH